MLMIILGNITASYESQAGLMSKKQPVKKSTPIQNIQGLRVWGAPESTRVVLDLSGKVRYQISTLDKPYRIVLDIDKAQSKAKWDEKSFKNAGIANVRISNQNNGKLRLVLELKDKAKLSSFLLSPNGAYGDRLVIDLSFASKKPAKMISQGQYSTRAFVVAIDAGHGGEDPGAIGRYLRLREKDVVLSVSKKLEALINAQKGMRAYLIRSGDYYVGLRKRMELAREQGADLFVSVHADSFKDSKATGASVFVLSEKGASNEAARWLAESENRADLVGGVSLEDKGNLLASVLLDLSQTASQSASQELANHLIQNLAKVTDMHHKSVQHAGFMVLKSPDIPSVLVELGFLSNQKSEEKLGKPAHQQALANALLSGVKAYASKRPPPVKHPEHWQMARAGR